MSNVAMLRVRESSTDRCHMVVRVTAHVAILEEHRRRRNSVIQSNVLLTALMSLRSPHLSIESYEKDDIV